VDELLSEKEQIEQLRAWWSEYGYFVIGGVVLGALILFGFNYYQNAERNAQEAASRQYDAVATAIAESDLEAAEAAAAELAANFGNSAYNAHSKLAMARLYMDKNRDQDAAESLRSLLDMSGFDNLQHVGRVRLGKILLYQGKPDEVLTLLEGQDSEAFAARYAELRGDAYVALDRPEDARGEYQAALLEQLPTVDQGLVQLKLMDLPRESIAMGDDDVADESDAEPGPAAAEPATEETADAAEESAE
jgi:predicted negative regulator of RcsB-dependent stress response